MPVLAPQCMHAGLHVLFEEYDFMHDVMSMPVSVTWSDPASDDDRTESIPLVLATAVL